MCEEYQIVERKASVGGHCEVRRIVVAAVVVVDVVGGGGSYCCLRLCFSGGVVV